MGRWQTLRLQQDLLPTRDPTRQQYRKHDGTKSNDQRYEQHHPKPRCALGRVGSLGCEFAQ
jgi:hypothetical protein